MGLEYVPIGKYTSPMEHMGNISPEKMLGMEDDPASFWGPFSRPIFQGWAVSCREENSSLFYSIALVMAI